ncbi:MAG: two-component system sensor protein no kinase domain [Bacteroidetes bacterium]|nr:two-component system sensor protein no kinase domain [Bacteroidota bacterium]
MKKIVIAFLHLGYWFMYLFLLLMIMGMLIMPQLESGRSFQWEGLFYFFSVFALIPGLLTFYSFYTFIFTRFLARKKIGQMIAYGLLTAILSALLGSLYFFIINHGHLVSFTEAHGIDYIFIAVMAFNALLNGILGLVMRGFITSYSDIRLKEELNKKNYETELALVKSQINPHFLFNTINNIDVLISRDPALASAYLNQLSDIMRFMLYEVKTEKIPLTKELTYIEKYIALQKIRSSNPDYVSYAVQGDSASLSIAPMLFIPFIENAFKHANNKKTENAITIRISIEKEKIIFECENRYSRDAEAMPDQSGIGNELIRKRLLLLYPGSHTLNVTDKDNSYKVNLLLENAH